jgi:hypothetical protein
MAWQILAVTVKAVTVLSCGPQPPDVQYVRQRIPVQVQKGKTLTIDIHSLSGNGVNDIGIRCSTELWNVLTNGTSRIMVRLKTSDKPDTEIAGVDPSSGGTAFFGYITNLHYLFYIQGRYRSKATVEVVFPSGPEKSVGAEIIVGKTPADTGL